ncbi:hypothetical protein [Lysobacter niastensis]|uniref:Uncharacterized protein n=1 Tax=Lysobacter niastensis TaxID=380629 RepID=A0ABS0B743_9GAMM|nr:hypothetical protein [Lysobacter niastensis]MBF6024838.1 hypothetical protein [Lysobacter niastensis]
MPRLYDRRSGRHLGTLTNDECAQLLALLDELQGDDELAPEPDQIEGWTATFASDRVMAVAQQVLQGREDFDLDWEPD